MDVDTFLESLKKNFNSTPNLTDITFKTCKIEPYNPLELPDKSDNLFGEKQCVLYFCQFEAYNISFSVRILCFVYSQHAEVLKLEIAISNSKLEQEIASCRNFLQRKRNVNLAFDILTRSARLYESRRLICETVISKQDGVTLVNRQDGVLIKCDQIGDPAVSFMHVHWTIAWNLDDLQLADFLEFFCNYQVLDAACSAKLREYLSNLVRGNVDFHVKLKVWKCLLQEMYGADYFELRPKNSSSEKNRVCGDVLEISDSDSEEDNVVIVTNTCRGSDDLSDNSSGSRQMQVTDEIFVID